MLALLATAAAVVLPVVTAPPAQAATFPAGFKSVGYLPSWAGSVTAVQYTKLTHINYAFVLPRANGTLGAVDNPGKLTSLVALGHANGVKVLVSIGGWNDGNDSAFETLAASPTGRAAFVNSVLGLVASYHLDGIDIDWEYPDPGTSGDHFRLLMTQLSGALHSRGKLLTAAVVSGGYTALGVQPAVFGIVDFLNIMLYDGGSPHANYSWTIDNVTAWKSRGLPAAKAVVGVPFYSRPNYYSYAQLVARDPANANRDCAGVNGVQECYNGLPTIRRKTQWAMTNAGGIMNWDLSQDSSGATSLLSAIAATAIPPVPTPAARTGQILGVASGRCVDVYWGRTADGTPLQLYDCNGTAAQRWTVASDGTVRALGRCLDVTAGGRTNGTKVQLWGCGPGNANQQWRPQADGTLRNPQSGRCLDAAGYGTANTTRLQVWDCRATGNQKWRLP